MRHVALELPEAFWTEIGAARCLQQQAAEAARDATSRGERPIVLSGNCNSAVGTVSGIDGDVGVIWLDAHPDLETPSTTESGFFDGQALSIVTGRCWGQIAATVPGFRAVADTRVILVGGRDASAAERALLESSGIGWIREPMLARPGDVAAALNVLRNASRRIYLHVDLDVHGAESIRANHYSSNGGPTADAVLQFVASVGERFDVAAAALTAFDPAADIDGRATTAALELLERLAEV